MDIEKLKQERDNWMRIATDKKARMFEYFAFYNYVTNNFEYGTNIHGQTGYKKKNHYWENKKPFKSDSVFNLAELFDFWLKDCEFINQTASDPA